MGTFCGAGSLRDLVLKEECLRRAKGGGPLQSRNGVAISASEAPFNRSIYLRLYKIHNISI